MQRDIRGWASENGSLFSFHTGLSKDSFRLWNILSTVESPQSGLKQSLLSSHFLWFKGKTFNHTFPGIRNQLNLKPGFHSGI